MSNSQHVNADVPHPGTHVVNHRELKGLVSEVARLLEGLDTGRGATLAGCLGGEHGLSVIIQVNPSGCVDAFLPAGVLVNGMSPERSVQATAALVAWGWAWPRDVRKDDEDVLIGAACGHMVPDRWLLANRYDPPYLWRSFSSTIDLAVIAEETLIAFFTATVGFVHAPFHFEGSWWATSPTGRGQAVDLGRLVR